MACPSAAWVSVSLCLSQALGVNLTVCLARDCPGGAQPPRDGGLSLRKPGSWEWGGLVPLFFMLVSTPSRKCGMGQARRGAGGGRGLVRRGSGLHGRGSGLPAPLPSLSTHLLLGVPLLFVIPWGIVKYLYEDEG